jgi:hypothetical protein
MDNTRGVDSLSSLNLFNFPPSGESDKAVYLQSAYQILGYELNKISEMLKKGYSAKQIILPVTIHSVFLTIHGKTFC